MNLKNVLIKITTIVVVVFTVVSCDDDFNSVGSEVIGDVNFQSDEYETDPIAYSKRFEKVQTSGLPNNLLGIYNDPVYGKTTYSVLSQIIPSRFDPTFGNDAVLDSIVFNLPYFSGITDTTVEDEVVTNTYELDSVYGSEKIRLSIYQSNYFLKDFEVGEETGERQQYFSDDISTIIENFGSMALEGELIASIEEYEPSDKEIILLSQDGTDADEDPDVSRVNPRIRIAMLSEAAAVAATALNPDNARVGDQDMINYFTELFLAKEGSIELSNANNFLNYFRGIYLKAESDTSEGNLVFFDINQANTTLYYSFNTDKVDEEDQDGDGNTTEFIRDSGELVLNFSNNIVNSIETDFNTQIEDELADQDEVNGEENLYIKGGEGSYAIIDLFNKYIMVDANEDFILDENENPIIIENPTEEEKIKTELDFLKSRDWLINEASMKVYINQDAVTSGETEPERIYLFNLETGGVLLDYLSDPTGNSVSPVNSVTQHLGRISRDSDQKGEFYKIGLTQHIINVLNGDTENVKFGLSVSQNVNIITNTRGFTPTNTEDEIIPFSSILSHEGTILYGNGTGVPEEKRLKLNIFYTELK